MYDIQQLQKLNDNKTLKYELQQLLAKVVKEEFGVEVTPESIEINQTTDVKFGDYTSNISLKLAKEVGKSPREIAEVIKENLQHAFIKQTEVAGPGFINFYLSVTFFSDVLKRILEERDSYGKWELSNEQVMVEFGQPNTHKAFHVGHLKSSITGLCLVRLMQNLGYEVIQANFFGDIGLHVAKCVWGFLKKGKPEGFDSWDPHTKMKYLDECYTYGSAQHKDSEEAKAEIIDINNKLYNKSDDNLFVAYLQTRKWSLEHQTAIFKKLGVVYDRQYPESETVERCIEIVKENIGKVFIEDQGAVIFPGEQYGLNRWVFLTSEKNPTYEAKDLALAEKKFEEFPNLSFNMTATSVEQNARFAGVIKALELIEPKYSGKYYHIGFGWLLQNKRKTSSRMGNTIKGMDIIEEVISNSIKKIAENKTYTQEEAQEIGEKVGLAGLKFLILSHELHKDINYDPEQFLNPEGFSGPYVLYGYVRAKSILRQNTEPETTSNKSYQPNASELQLLKLLSQYPSVSLDAAKTLSPHKICNYLFDLTQNFNQFYRENKVLVEENEIKNFRLQLTEAVSIVLQNGLGLLGIETLEQM